MQRLKVDDFPEGCTNPLKYWHLVMCFFKQIIFLSWSKVTLFTCIISAAKMIILNVTVCSRPRFVLTVCSCTSISARSMWNSSSIGQSRHVCGPPSFVLLFWWMPFVRLHYPTAATENKKEWQCSSIHAHKFKSLVRHKITHNHGLHKGNTDLYCLHSW